MKRIRLVLAITWTPLALRNAFLRVESEEMDDRGGGPRLGPCLGFSNAKPPTAHPFPNFPRVNRV